MYTVIQKKQHPLLHCDGCMRYKHRYKYEKESIVIQHTETKIKCMADVYPDKMEQVNQFASTS